MVSLLIFIGILLVGLSFWIGKTESARQQEEFRQLNQTREELLTAKKEVGTLLEQIETVSEKVVQEISARVEEAKLLDKEQRIPEGTDEENVELDEEIEEEIDREIEEEIDEGEKTRGSVLQMRKKAYSEETAMGKKIIFPWRKDNFINKGHSAANKNLPANETPPKHQMVYAMDKLGYSSEEIAKQLKMGKGEVKLILQLKRKGEEVNA